MIFDTLENLEMYIPMVPKIRVVADSMDHDEIYDKPRGRYTTYDKDVTYEVQEGFTCDAASPFTVHKHQSVVCIVLSGHELESTTWRELKDEASAYDSKTDTSMFVAEPLSAIQGAQGRFTLFFAGEPYKIGVSLGEAEKVKRVVFRINEE